MCAVKKIIPTGGSIMFSIRSFLIALFSLSMILFSAYSAEQKSTMTSSVDVWVPVDESDWAVYMDAPAYHFALAKEYLQKGDNLKAAAELKRGNSFVVFEKTRLDAASKQIEELAKNIGKGKDTDIAAFNTATANVEKVIDRKYAMVPVDVGATTVFEDAYKYHFDRAKSKMQENDRPGAATELRRGAAFLKLRALQTGRFTKAKIDATGTDLKDLASSVETGTVKDWKELDKGIQKAVSDIFKKKE